MANKRNDWQMQLGYANDDLTKRGYRLCVNKQEDGYYSIIIQDGKSSTIYAENLFEEELSDTISEARSYVFNASKSLYIVSYVALSSDPDANGFCEVKAFRTRKDAETCRELYKSQEIDFLKEEGYEYNVTEEDHCTRICWNEGEEQVKIDIHEVLTPKQL